MTRRLWFIVGGVLASLIVAVSVIVVFRVGGDSQDPEWLLAHSSASASISMDVEGGTTLTLFGPDKSIAMFTDRPERQTALISVDKMITNWDTWFAGDPPNAALSDGSQDPNFIVMTLSSPQQLESGDLQFVVTLDSQKSETPAIQSGGEVHLFIDPLAARLTEFHQVPLATPDLPTPIPSEGNLGWIGPGEPPVLIGDIGLEVGPDSDS